MIRSAPPSSMAPHKRKTASLDDFLETKRPTGMFALKQEFGRLLQKKKEFIASQRRGSLLVQPVVIGEEHPMKEFAAFYRKVSNAPMNPEEHPAQLKLIEQIIQESIVIEWPKNVPGIDGEREIDMAPLIHRARNVVKCRTSHPTLRVKVFAISNEPDEGSLRAPSTIEAFFRATLVKLSSESGEPRQVAGRMILTQREGTAAAKAPDQTNATVTADGKLVASQAAADTTTYVILDQMNEPAARTTPFRYENGVLCATFPEMGVTLNSMVDRRQLATRYAVQVEVTLNIDNKLIISHVILSHAFLIAITNDQIEPLLHSIFWGRLADPVEAVESIDPPLELSLEWSQLRVAIQNFIKTQMVQARQLHHHEICHIQTMILLPRLIRCSNTTQVINLEAELFGNLTIRGNKEPREAIQELRDRLLSEQVFGSTLIEKKEFMLDKCYSILDMTTELGHSVWLWLFRVSEMIQDVGHRLCPSPQLIDKKSSKTKKQMAASEEYQTMYSLFNKNLLTLSSIHAARHAFRHAGEEGRTAMLVRFCDENCGHFSFVFGAEELFQVTVGSISSDQIKDFKQGLAEVLIDESYPSKFDKMVQIESKSEDGTQISVTLLKKHIIFHNYMTTRTRNDLVQVLDNETQRINPLTGEKLERATLPSSLFPSLSIPQLGQESSIWPAHLLVFFQQHLARMKAPEGFSNSLLPTAPDGESDDGSAAEDKE